MVCSTSSLFTKHTYSSNVIYIRHGLFIVERLVQSATSNILFLSLPVVPSDVHSAQRALRLSWLQSGNPGNGRNKMRTEGKDLRKGQYR